MKLGVNLGDNDDSIQRGSEGENNFVKVASTKGYKVHKSSKTEDIHGHIDYWLENEKGDRKSVDVKGRKKGNRSDTKFSEDWVWIEFKNVQGKNGWVKGKADFVAFEFENSFLLVKRAELRQLARELIKDRSKRARYGGEAKNVLYSRESRPNELITQIRVADIKNNLKTWEWCK